MAAGGQQPDTSPDGGRDDRRSRSGRERTFGATMPTALDLLFGGWQYTISARFYSGRPLLFGTSYDVSGNPKLDNPTRDQWFDTTKFAVLQRHEHAAHEPVVSTRASTARGRSSST